MMDGVPMMLAAAVSVGSTLVPEVFARTKRVPKVDRPDVGLADYIPARRLVRPDVVKCEQGYLAAWRIAAPDAGMLPTQTIVNTAYQVAGTIGLLASDSMAQFYVPRSRFREYDRGLSRGDHPVLELLDDLREEQFLHRTPVFDSECFVALTWSAPSGMREALRAAASAGLDALRCGEDQMLAEFEARCRRFEASLCVALSAERLAGLDEDGYRRSNVLRFVGRMISGEDKPLNVPPPTVPLNEFFARDFVAGLDVRIGEDEIGLVEILTPPDEAEPMMLDALSELQVSHTLVVRVIGMSLNAAQQALGDAVADLRGAADFNTRGFTNPADQRGAEQMTEAYGDAGDEQKRIGMTSVAIVVRAKTRPEVILAQQAVVDALEGSGFRAVIPKQETFDTFLATFPGQRKHGMRRFPVDALTTAKALPLHERSKGLRYNDSESFPS